MASVARQASTPTSCQIRKCLEDRLFHSMAGECGLFFGSSFSINPADKILGNAPRFTFHQSYGFNDISIIR